jgi:hypothetical protein
MCKEYVGISKDDNSASARWLQCSRQVREHGGYRESIEIKYNSHWYYNQKDATFNSQRISNFKPDTFSVKVGLSNFWETLE